MDITAVGKQPSYIETVNKKNIEDQDKRMAENLSNARKWQDQLEGLREMQMGYNISKLPMAQELIGESVDVSV